MAMQAEKYDGRKQTDSPVYEPPANPVRNDWLLVVVSLICLVLTSLGAYQQPVHMDAYRDSTAVTSLAWWLYPVERNAYLRLPYTADLALNAIHTSPDGQKIWVVGEGALILHSPDGGLHWEYQRYPGEELGDKPQAAEQETGAWNRWLPIASAFAADVERSPRREMTEKEILEEFPDGLRMIGPAGGSQDEQRAGTDETSVRIKEEAEKAADKIIQQYRDSEQQALLPETPDTGAKAQDTGQDQAAAIPALTSVHFENELVGWAAGEDGFLIKTTDGGQSWSVSSEAYPAARKDSPAPATPGVQLTTSRGEIVYITADGAAPVKLWRDEPLEAGALLQYRRWPAPWYWLSLPVLSLVAGFGLINIRIKTRASDADGTDYGDDNRGERTRSGSPARSIAQEGISDRPINWSDPDYLGLKNIARSLSRVIRNVNTEPPLVIGVTGPWGSGKSSLMNLLREDLCARGFSPVWFNAWHQQEAQLLANLLHKLKSGISPSRGGFWYWVQFRCRLIRERGWLYRLSFVLSGVIMACALIYTVSTAFSGSARSQLVQRLCYEGGVTQPVFVTSQVVKELEKADVVPSVVAAAACLAGAGCPPGLVLQVSGESAWCRFDASINKPGGPAMFQNKHLLLSAIAAQVERPLSLAEHESLQKLVQVMPPAPWPGFRRSYASYRIPETLVLEGVYDWGSWAIGGISIAFVLLLGALRAITAFGFSPLDLFNKALRLGSDPADRDVGFRDRFAHEFGIVTRAMRPKPLVLMIDDLDRCSPEHVVKVLETINFLVTAGECFVVVGMDRGWVEDCVSSHYKSIAEHREQPGRDFARRYLKKLINMEVAIPTATEEQSRMMLAHRRARLLRRKKPWLIRRRLRVFLHGWRHVRAVAIFAPLLGLLRSFRQLPGAGLVTRNLGMLVTILLLVAVSFFFILKAEPGQAIEIQYPVVAGATDTPESETGQASAPGSAFMPESAFRSLQLDSPRDEWSYLPSLLILVLIGTAALFMYRIDRLRHQLAPRIESPRDTPDFTRALNIWHPWIVQGDKTPRELKRFKNRVRFLAARASATPDPRNFWERIFYSAANWLGFCPACSRARAGILTDELIVALAAIEHGVPDVVQRSGLKKTIGSANHEVLGDFGYRSYAENETPHPLVQCFSEFQKAFTAEWPPTDDQIAAYESISAHLRQASG